MKKREYDEMNSKNISGFQDLLTLETSSVSPTDEIEFATEKEFGAYTSVTDKMASRGRKSHKTSKLFNKEQIEEAKEDVETLLEKVKEQAKVLFELDEKLHLYTKKEEENAVAIQERKAREAKVAELYEKLKSGLLREEDYSDLIVYKANMDYYELVRNYVYFGLCQTTKNTEKLVNEKQNKVLVIHKPLITRIKEKINALRTNDYEQVVDKLLESPQEQVDSFKTGTDIDTQADMDEIQEVYSKFWKSLFDGELDQTLAQNYTEADIEKMIKETERLRSEYDKLDISTKFTDDNSSFNYSFEDYQRSCNAWDAYIESLNKTVKMLQTMHLKRFFVDVQKYKKGETKSGNVIYCQFGDDTIAISNRHQFDDIDLFYRKRKEYEETLKNGDNKEETTKDTEPKIVEDPLKAIKDIEIPLPSKEESTQPEEQPAKDTEPKIVEDPLKAVKDIEIPLPSKEESTQPEEQPAKDTEPKIVEDPLKAVKDIEIPLPSKEESTQPEKQPVKDTEPKIFEGSTINTSKQAYIEFMCCFVTRDEAEEFAQDDENVEMFERSNIGFNKYIDDINTGKISKDTTYENYIVETLTKDNGIKYDTDTKTVEPHKDDSGLDVIVADSGQPIINPEPDLSGFDVFADDPMQFTDVPGQFTPKTR